MNSAIFFSLTSPVFLLILIIGVFSFGRNVFLEKNLRSCKEVSNSAVGDWWSILASPSMSASFSTSFKMAL